jgi:hypothetical protein
MVAPLSLSLGLFEVFTYMVPGSLYLAVLLFISRSLHLVDLSGLKDVPSIVVVAGLLIASYLLGSATEPMAEMLSHALRFRASSQEAAIRHEFAVGVPGAAGRPFVEADICLLLAATEIHAKDAALEISRLRATGLMLRNCSVPLLAAAVVALTEAVTGHHTAPSVICAAFLAAATLSALRAGKRLRIWAVSKTLQVCYWIPEIDETIRQGSTSPRQRRLRPTRPPT